MTLGIEFKFGLEMNRIYNKNYDFFTSSTSSQSHGEAAVFDKNQTLY